MKKTVTSLCLSAAVCALAFSTVGCGAKKETAVLATSESTTGNEDTSSAPSTPASENGDGGMMEVWYDGTLLDLSATKDKSFLDIVRELQDLGLTAYSINGTTTNDVYEMDVTIQQIAAAAGDIGEIGLLKIDFREGDDDPFLTLSYSETTNSLTITFTKNNEKLNFTEKRLSFTDLANMDGKKLVSEKLFDTISEDGVRLEVAGKEPLQRVSYLSGKYYLNYQLPVKGYGSLSGENETETTAAITTGEGTKQLIENLGILTNGDTELNFAQWIDDDNLDNTLSLLDQVDGTTEKYWSVFWSIKDASGSISEPTSAAEVREQYEMFREACQNQEGYGYFSFGFYFNAVGQEAVTLNINTKDNVLAEKKAYVMYSEESDNLVGKEKFTLPGKDWDFIKENILKGLNQKEEDMYYLSDDTYEITVELDDEAVENIEFKKVTK